MTERSLTLAVVTQGRLSRRMLVETTVAAQRAELKTGLHEVDQISLC